MFVALVSFKAFLVRVMNFLPYISNKLAKVKLVAICTNLRVFVATAVMLALGAWLSHDLFCSYQAVKMKLGHAADQCRESFIQNQCHTPRENLIKFCVDQQICIDKRPTIVAVLAEYFGDIIRTLE